MPKKRLTKKQVLTKMQKLRIAYYDLFLDKFSYGSESLVPMSADKLKDVHTQVVSAILRLKRK